MATTRPGKRRRRAPDKTGRGGEQYIKLPYGVVHHHAWRRLSGPALKILIELRSRYNGGNNGRLTLSLREAAKLLGIGKSTAQRGFEELASAGFIVLVTEGSWYGRKADEWRCTDIPTDREAATRDWQHPRSDGDGPAKIQKSVLRRDSSEA